MYKTFAYWPRNIVGRCGMQNAVWGTNLIGRKNKQTAVNSYKSGGGSSPVYRPGISFTFTFILYILVHLRLKKVFSQNIFTIFDFFVFSHALGGLIPRLYTGKLPPDL